MEMLPDSTLRIRVTDGLRGAQHPQSEVFFEGRPTGVSIPGATLECAVSWKSSYVLFTTDDIPQEETLHICLLGEDLQLLDYANIGAMYSTGHLSGLRLEEPDEIRFRFFGDTDWTLHLSNAPAFHLPMMVDPKGVSRPLRLSTYLRFNADPRADTT